MHSSYLPAVLALVSAVSASPATEPVAHVLSSRTIVNEDLNATFGLAHVEYRRRSDGAPSHLGKREEHPDYCEALRGNRDWAPRNYFWTKDAEPGKESCLTFSSEPSTKCVNKDWWADNEVNDMLAAMKEQVTKDGLTQNSEKGRWTVYWGRLTTAVPDRDSYYSQFERLLKNLKFEPDVGKPKTFDYAHMKEQTSTTTNDCPDQPLGK